MFVPNKMDPEYRVKKYIGNLHNEILVRQSGLALDPLKGMNVYSFHNYQTKDFPEINGSYYHDMTRYLSLTPHLHDSQFLFFVGDTSVKYDVPIFVKTRPSSDFGYGVLMDLDHSRHFNPLSVVDQEDTIPFHEKKNVLIWRGATTGPGFDEKPHRRHTSRATLVSQYCQTANKYIDVGLSSMTNTVKTSSQGDYYSQFLKPSISLPDLLSYKFHLSVEGHDVATNLKWVLYSNCVPFCPPFFVQSWILEDELIPWTHYIPVKGDYSDLDKQVEWAMGHPTACQKIAQEGRHYIEQFLDLEQEAHIRQSVLEHYVKNVKII